MARTYKKKLKAYEDLRGDLVAERVLNREMRKRLSSMRHELRSAKARLNDLVHFIAVSRGGSSDCGSDRASSDNAATG